MLSHYKFTPSITIYKPISTKYSNGFTIGKLEYKYMLFLLTVSSRLAMLEMQSWMQQLLASFKTDDVYSQNQNIKHERLDSSWILCTLSLEKEKYTSLSRPIVCFFAKVNAILLHSWLQSHTNPPCINIYMQIQKVKNLRFCSNYKFRFTHKPTWNL